LCSLKEFLPLAFMKVKNVEKKIFAEHKSLVGVSEIDAKYKYVKLARGLPTFGVHFFLVKVREFIVYKVCLLVDFLYCGSQKS
jgi:FERM central domain